MELKPVLGYFGSNKDATDITAWALVIHYAFKGHENNMERLGNEADVENLRSTFLRRGCLFCEKGSLKKQELQEFFKDDLALKKFFLESAETKFEVVGTEKAPDVLFLFILSHGDENGEIYTEEKIKILDGKPLYQSFNIEFIFGKLKEMSFLKDCLISVFLGPCRGTEEEQIVHTCSSEDQKFEPVPSDANRFLIEPNSKNFIVVYSTTEKMASNRDSDGTWMVKSLCLVLNGLNRDMDILELLTSVQRHIDGKTRAHNEGQTCELRYFPHQRFTFCRSLDEPAKIIARDGRAGNLDNIRTIDGIEYYSWNPGSKRKAYIFKSQARDSFQLEENLQNLYFTVETNHLQNLIPTLEKVAHGEEKIENICTMVIVMGAIIESKTATQKEICVDIGKTIVPVQNLTRMFTGIESRKLLGDPKFFFLLDDLKRPQFTDGTSDRFEISSANHAGIYSFLAIGEEVVNGVIEGFGSPELRTGGSIQTEMAKVIRSAPIDKSPLLTQVTTTLPCLVSFPGCANVYIQPSFEMQGKVQDFDAMKMQITTATEKRPKILWLLSAQSGMGKTLATEEMSKRLQNSLSSFKIVTINAADLEHYEYFESLLEKEVETPDGTEFLRRILAAQHNQLASKTQEELIENGKIFVMIDRIDEMTESEHKEFLMKIVQQLSTKFHVWIAARPEEARNFEEEMKLANIIKFSLSGFKKKDQIKFLRAKLSLRDDEIRQKLENYRQKSTNEVLENPLHLYLFADMIAVDLQSDNLYDIYDNFFNERLKYVMKNYEYLDMTKRPHVSKQIKLRKATLRKAACLVALPKKVSEIKIHKTELSQVEKLDELIVTSGAIRSFQHQTYTEYFLSQLFFEDLDTALLEKNDLIEFLTQVNFRQVRLFLDNAFVTHEEKCKKFLTRLPPLNILAKEMKQKILLVICKEGLANLFGAFYQYVESNPSENAWFEEIQHECLYYACRSNEDIALLLIKSKNDLEKMIKKYYNQEFSCFLECIKAGRLQVMKILNELGVDYKGPQDHPVDETLIREPLNNAISGGKRDCAEYIFDLYKKEDDRIIREAFDSAFNQSTIRTLIDLYCDSSAARRREPEDDYENFLKVNKTSILKSILNRGSALFVGVKEGALDCVKQMVEKGAKVDEQDINGWTPLHVAASTAQLECGAFLIEKGAQVNMCTNEGRPPIFHVFDFPHVGFVSMLFKNGSFGDFTDNEKNNVLHYMLSKGTADYLEFMLSQPRIKKLLNETNSAGKTALHIAVEKGLKNAVDILIASGANINLKDNSDSTPLHAAVTCGNLEIVKVFCSRQELNLEMKNANGDTPAVLAKQLQKCEIAEFLEETLTKKGINLNKADKHRIKRREQQNENTSNPYKDFLNNPNQEYKNSNYILEVRDSSGNILDLSFEEYIETKLMFLNKPSSSDFQVLNAPEMYMDSSISENENAVKNGHVEKIYSPQTFDFMQKQGIFGKSLLHFAARFGQSNILEHFLHQDKSMVNHKDLFGLTPLHMAIISGKTDILKLLLENEAVVNVESNNGTTPLCLAFLMGSQQAIHTLLTCDNLNVSEEYNGFNVIFESSKLGFLEVLEACQKKGINLDQQNDLLETPLMFACYYGHEECVEYLLSLHTGNINQTSKVGKFPLLFAAATNHFNVCNMLLQHGADINLKDSDGIGPLHIAIGRKHFDLALWLLEQEDFVIDDEAVQITVTKGNAQILEKLRSKNADLLKKDERFRSPAHLAAISGNTECLGMLLDLDTPKVNIEEKCHSDYTLLHLAAKEGHAEVIKLLLERGAQTNARDFQGVQPLHLAVIQSHEECALLLLEKDSSGINERLPSGESLMHFAAKMSGGSKLLEELIRAGGDTTAKSADGKSVMSFAISAGNVSAVKLLLNEFDKDEINHKDDGYGPLAFAVLLDQPEIFEVLADAGADLNLADDLGRTAAFYALVKSDEVFERIISRDGVNINAETNKKRCLLFCAAESGELNKMKMLVKRGLNVNKKDLNGQTPLTAAIRLGREDIIDYLLTFENLDVTSKQHEDTTPLHLAVSCNKVEITKKLLRKVNVTERSSKGKTALYFAVRFAGEEMVKLLLEQEGIDVNAQEEEGTTPLHMAAMRDLPNLIQILLQSGANPNIPDCKGNLPLHNAVESSFNKSTAALAQVTKPIDAKNKNGQTALHLAINNLNLVNMQILVNVGANVNSRDSNGESPLYLGVFYDYEECLQILTSKNAQIDFEERFHNLTLLQVAYQDRNFHAFRFLVQRRCNPFRDLGPYELILYDCLRGSCKESNEQIFTFLCQQEVVNLNCQLSAGVTPLSMAISMGFEPATRVILERGADVNQRNESGETALIMSIVANHPTLMQILLQHPEVEVDATDSDGLTALHYAAQDGLYKAMEILLQNGADANLQDAIGYTSLHRVLQSGNLECINLLLSVPNVNVNLRDRLNGFAPVHMALAMRLEDAALALAEKEDADVNLRVSLPSLHDTYIGFTPLHIAAAHGLTRFIRRLKEKGAQLDIPDAKEQTPLHLAANNSQEEAIKMLLEEGVDCNAKDNQGQTPLFLAAAAGNNKCVFALLKDVRIKLNETNANGETAILTAARNKHWGVVQILIDYEADLELKDSNGHCALDELSNL
ncbi:uncharacterized protein LOC132195582 [Neocloeon triangulifer]|uniref:uncharacterized protein LOC132195582 n=1 Tax=Neocloeon triangulifer TaxID=2078957 RepID=UPI00286EECF3|nr:uncharacterized protein LOC132195582 [Neocloeon triangulifer]XP_059473665.1 uncharacterized protein LOC132195582 [Neocloeon triangulifer]